MEARWVDVKEGHPLRVGEYLVIRRMYARRTKQDRCFWNGRSWTSHGQPVESVECWLKEGRDE